MLHLSPNALNSILTKFLNMTSLLQGLEYFLNSLKSEKLGTVIEALVFKTTHILARFVAQISDL